jgi:hypothetical protein
MTPIPGETWPTYMIMDNGSYAVIVTENGCSETSNCFSTSGDAVSETEFSDIVSVYPNPSQGEFTIDLGNAFEEVDVTLTDARGRVILEETYDAQVKRFSFYDVERGVYFLRISAEGRLAVMRLVKQ